MWSTCADVAIGVEVGRESPCSFCGGEHANRDVHHDIVQLSGCRLENLDLTHLFLTSLVFPPCVIIGRVIYDFQAFIGEVYAFLL